MARGNGCAVPWHSVCAFFEDYPIGERCFQETFAGNETICTSQNNLGTYYLDNMYTMSLTAYMQPVFLYCIDWKDNVLLILSCFLCILLFGLFFM